VCRRKEVKRKKKLMKISSSESCEEDGIKFTLQVETKVPSMDKKRPSKKVTRIALLTIWGQQRGIGGGWMNIWWSWQHPLKTEYKEVAILFSEREAEILVLEDNAETAVLDTGCARSTAGQEWIEANIIPFNILQWKNLQIQAISPHAGYFCNTC
jgi:hypothetical protein